MLSLSNTVLLLHLSLSIAGNRKHIPAHLANKNIKEIIIHFPPSASL